MPAFFHEKSALYRKALDLAAAANKVAIRLPRERYYLKNQIGAVRFQFLATSLKVWQLARSRHV
jgi:hypothetical protein